MKSIDDPVFGTLTYETNWEGKVEVPGLGRRNLVSLSVFTLPPKSPPNDSHYEIFQEFLEAMKGGLRDRLAVAVYNVFRQRAKRLRK
jgi:hypothetical protein